MTIWKIYRLRRGPKRLNTPALLHNRIEAENAAEALQRYHLLNPGANVRDLEAREA